MITQKIKLLISLLLLLTIYSCSNDNYDIEDAAKYCGVFKSKNNGYLTIKKAGDSGFIITRNEYYLDKTKYYAFKDGCFIFTDKKRNKEHICINGPDKLICEDTGDIYLRK